MTFIPNSYSIILIICGLITLYMCVRVFRRYEIVVRWFGFMMLGIAIWALSYGLELSSTSLEQMLFWINVEYLGKVFIPAFGLLFLLKFTAKDKWPLGLLFLCKDFVEKNRGTSIRKMKTQICSTISLNVYI